MAFIATSPNLVTVIDASTKLVVCTITVGNGPSNLAFSPDGTQLFVVNDADTTISVVSLADGSIQATIDLTPFGVTAGTSGITANLAASPDGSSVYVVSLPNPFPPAATQAKLNVISLPSLAVSSAISVVANPPAVATPVTAAGLGIAFSPDATLAYITTEGLTYIINMINTAISNTTISANGGTAAIDQNGSFAYIADVADKGAGNNTVLNKIPLATNTPASLSPAPACNLASTATVTPDTASAYFTCPGTDSVQLIDTTTNTINSSNTLSLPVGTFPQGVAVTSNGAFAFVAGGDGSITFIDTSVIPNTFTTLADLGAKKGLGFPPVLVAVTPSPKNVQVNTTQTFLAALPRAFSPTVTWSLACAAGISLCGSIDPATGVFTAPAMVPSDPAVTIFADSIEVTNSSKLFFRGSATATITDISVAISPATPTVDINATDQFTLTLVDATNGGVNWTISCVAGVSVCGTVDTNGLYTAPQIVPSPATVTVTATSKTDNTKSDSKNISITSKVKVTVTPPADAPPFLINQTYQFTATTLGDNNNLGVTWSLGTCNLTVTANNPQPCGTISANGLYIAPKIVTPTNAITIQAASVADPSQTGTLQITITSGVTVNILAPAGAPPFLINQTYQFTATTPGDNNSLGVTWSLGTCNLTVTANNPQPCGTIAATTGVYTAPLIVTTANAVTIQATSKADASKIGTFQSTITSNVAITGFQVNGGAPPAQLVIETASYALTPVITGDTGQGVIWSILSCSAANPASSKCGQFTNASTGVYASPLIVPYTTPVTPSSTASVTFQATSVADPLVSKTFTINVGSTIQLSMPASISNVLIGGSVDFTPKTTGGNVTLVNDTNQGVTLAITGTCFAPPNFGSSATIPCGSFNGNSYSAPPVVPLSSAPPASLSQATKAQITVTATSVADPAHVASTTFVISSNISFTVLLGVDTTTLQNTGPTAASPTLAVGGPTSGYNTANYLESNSAGFGSVTGLNWQATAGNIQAASGNQSAMYTSPAAVPNPATVTITGFAIADFTKTATASIPIVASKFVYANASSIGSTVQITIPSNASSGSLDLDFLGPTSGQITLACSNFVQLPNSSCSFSPNTTTSSSATGETLVTLTLSVTRSGGAYLRPPLAPGTPLPGLPGSDSVITLLTLLILVFAAKNRIRFLWAPASRWNRAFAVLLLCAVALTWAAACGQFSQPNTPAPPIPPTQTATGSVTVTGTPTTNSSASTDSLVVMVHVN